MLRVLIALIVGLALGGFATRELGPRLFPEAPTQASRRLALLVEENDRLRALVEDAERAKTLAKSKVQRDAVEKAVEEIRGLNFKTPVDYQPLDRKQIKETIAGKMAEVFSEQEFKNMTAALARLGLLPEGYPLRQSYIDLLGEQVAAFYDQHSHKLVMFEDASLDNAQNRVVLAHELTHALQDQHFGLARLPLEIKDNDDRAAAASALCEGDATLVMTEFMLKNFSLAALKDSMTASLTQNMDQLAKAPRYLREMLVFPYLRGQEFCSVLHGSGGYEAINRAYANLPASTAQILHPEKFVGLAREQPLRVDWTHLKLGEQAPIADNVLGEMGLRILLSEWLDAETAERVSNGWRGDRYLCYDDGAALVWKVCWSTPAQATAFIEAMTEVFQKRYPGQKRVTRCLQPRPTEVLVVDCPTDQKAAALVELFGKE